MHTPTFELSAGATCLDFANTLGDRPSGHDEKLASYPDVLAWAVQARILDADTARRLEALARLQPVVAQRTLRTATALREVVYRLFAAVAAHEPPRPRDLSHLNRALARAMSRLRVAGHGGSFQWRWEGEGDVLDCLLWPVVRSAADLLVSVDRERVRECDGAGCSWLFMDRSPRGNRRWCDMASCGNRAKARRHYQRVRRREG